MSITKRVRLTANIFNGPSWPISLKYDLMLNKYSNKNSTKATMIM